MSRLALDTIRDEHAALKAVLRSMLKMIARGPGEQPERFFDVLRAMLFYIDEFPEKLHHPKESMLLFPRLARSVPQLAPIIELLESDHAAGQFKVRELQHMLLAWELIGDSRRAAFGDAADRYAQFYLAHMRTEETELLPHAEKALTPDDWVELNQAFRCNNDPLAGGIRSPDYDRLFARIVMAAPGPIGMAPGIEHALAS
jgi:hemerythrin-like domain-containing protein